jgi:hypothetical protein
VDGENRVRGHRLAALAVLVANRIEQRHIAMAHEQRDNARRRAAIDEFLHANRDAGHPLALHPGVGGEGGEREQCG